ncbi:hypothetical protein DSO57_1022946 [Entomophthora muscae]|uniref:Uncharacterized protein n=1 Tax=Entomophthora muscae TaxID=34485 RepID=A0ACC2RHS2_9FUNG|nr:hypothetical protein DSO57_1022946 [Entomophthora muscae]
MEFLDCFYLEAQTLVSMRATTFLDVRGALLNFYGQLGNLSWDFRQPKVNIFYLGHKESKDNKNTEEKEEEEDNKEPKKLLSSQVEDKTLTASSNHPSLTIDPNPDIPDYNSCLLDQEAFPDQYFSDK